MIDGGQYSKGNEKFVLEMRNKLIEHALMEGKHVIVDDTNLYQKHEDDIRALVDSYNKATNSNVVVEVNDSFLDVSVEECVKRDLKRDASVGAEVIIGMARKHLPKYDYCVPEIDAKRCHANGLPWCVIYDLDGTAAIMGDRSPYDASKCDEVDRPNHALHGVLNLIQYAVEMEPAWDNLKIIAMSGRPSQYREPTERFLAKHNFPYSALYMRQEGDTRKDAIIKGELFDEHIKGKYNVLVVFDDRDQMVDFWRKEVGVPCFQVNYGDF